MGRGRTPPRQPTPGAPRLSAGAHPPPTRARLALRRCEFFSDHEPEKLCDDANNERNSALSLRQNIACVAWQPGMMPYAADTG